METVKWGGSEEGWWGLYGTGDAAGGAAGRRAASREGFAWELLRRPAGPYAGPDAQGDRPGVYPGRRARAGGAARLLPDPGDLPLHPVPGRGPRRPRQLQPGLRQRALRLPEQGNARARLRPHRDVHRADLAQRGHGAGPALGRHPRHDLGRLGSLLGPHKRPQPRLRRAGDAAVLEGKGDRHSDDARALGAGPGRGVAPDLGPLHRRDHRRGLHPRRRVRFRVERGEVAGGAALHGRHGCPALLLRPGRRAAVSLDHARRLRRHRPLGAGEPRLQPVPRQRLQHLRQDLRLHWHGDHPAALPLHLVAHHPLRRDPERHAREDEGGDLRPADPGRPARPREAGHLGRGGNGGGTGRRQVAVERDGGLWYTCAVRRSGRVVEGGTLLRCYTSLTGYRGFESLLLRSESATFAGTTQNPRSGPGSLPALTTPTGTPTRSEAPAPKAFQDSAASIAAAVWSPMPGGTWEYLSSLRATEACPRRS